MLKHKLMEYDDNIDYEMYWKKTIMYRVFNKKKPTESWKAQLRRIKSRN